ncbi:MAG: hypothetical protein HYV63_33205, partial [Candidatus Schekmanbacteria bacterium]|nr:hypothetical protein [Candidatus Schekmanbacteria bacterium]
RYLERLGLDRGALLIFDRRPAALPLPDRATTAEVAHAGRRVRVVRL